MNFNLSTTSLSLQNITLKINNKNNLKLKLKETVMLNHPVFNSLVGNQLVEFAGKNLHLSSSFLFFRLRI